MGWIPRIARRRINLWLVALPFLVASCGGTDAAKHGVGEFRARVSERSYGQIFRTAGPELRQVATEDQFVQLMTALDRKLGLWESASEPAWNVMRGTAGHVVNLTYQSRFAKGAASEQFTWRIEHGKAVLIGYHVNSPLLITE